MDSESNSDDTVQSGSQSPGTSAQIRENSALDVLKERKTPFGILLWVWTFPYWYLFVCIFSVAFAASAFRLLGLNISGFISANTVILLLFGFPVLLFVWLSFQKGSFRKHLFYLPFLWMLQVATMNTTMGTTQGAFSSALSKAFSAGQ